MNTMTFLLSICLSIGLVIGVFKFVEWDDKRLDKKLEELHRRDWSIIKEKSKPYEKWVAGGRVGPKPAPPPRKVSYTKKGL